MTLLERYCELIWDMPYWTEVYGAYESGVGRLQERDYTLDFELRKVKGTLRTAQAHV